MRNLIDGAGHLIAPVRESAFGIDLPGLALWSWPQFAMGLTTLYALIVAGSLFAIVKGAKRAMESYLDCMESVEAESRSV